MQRSKGWQRGEKLRMLPVPNPGRNIKVRRPRRAVRSKLNRTTTWGGKGAPILSVAWTPTSPDLTPGPSTYGAQTSTPTHRVTAGHTKITEGRLTGLYNKFQEYPPSQEPRKNSDIKDPNGTPETGKTTHKPKPNWRSDPFNPDHQRPSVVKNPS